MTNKLGLKSIFSISIILFAFFLQEEPQGDAQHQEEVPAELRHEDLDLLQQVMSQSDLDMDQTTVDEDLEQAAADPTSPPSQGPEVVLSPHQFRIRDAEDEDEHNEVLCSCVQYCHCVYKTIQ